MKKKTLRHSIERWWLCQVLLLKFSPCELIDALNKKENSIGIIFNSFDQRDEVCLSPIHPFEFLFVCLFNWYTLCTIYLMRIYMKDSSCSSKHLNPVYVKRYLISCFLFNHVCHNNIRKHHKSLMIISFFMESSHLYLLMLLFL